MLNQIQYEIDFLCDTFTDSKRTSKKIHPDQGLVQFSESISTAELGYQDY